ncbi:mammalian cell entry protein [Gordonia terrae]|uniref:Mammalian cell entry protein n=1 Tax=Gordonia terrae TaxID=2055 RepID=A0A2I1R3Y7_9ACTN|nr:MCE family protein [Gordonia terrae]PKZ63852.1 mammalian cell entry protein [Gordonia terrae]UPW10080.1 MCE family protein [Gordonia terrae]
MIRRHKAGQQKRSATSAAGSLPGKVLVVLVAIAVVAVVTAMYNVRSGSTSLSITFRNSAGLYVGDRVMILGVPVGTVDAIEPRPDGVNVDVTVEDGYPVPADARAAIIAPTLVSGRYVQLAPAYTGGPQMADGSSISVGNTATPVEFDEIKQQLVQLSDDLGPSTTDQQGSLNRFLDASASTLKGNGSLLRDALTQLSKATTTLNDGGNDLFATVRNLSTVTSSLSESDQQISAFTNQLAGFSTVLADNRTELASLLASLNGTFDRVKTFLDTNRAALLRDVGKANTISGLLVKRMDTLAEILHGLPTALSDFYNIYDPKANSLTGALGIPDIPDPRSLICALLTTVNAPADQCRSTITQLHRNAAAATTRTGIQGGGHR